MPINVAHQPAAAAYAPLALNAGVGGLLESYANFLQPERLQQRGFQQQNQQQAFDFFANSALGQQRAQQQAELQRQQNLQALQSNLIRGQQAQQYDVFNRVLGSQLDFGSRYALNDQLGGQRYGLQELEGAQRAAALERQAEIYARRQEVGFQNDLFQMGVREQDQYIRQWRQANYNQLTPDVRAKFEGLNSKRSRILTSRDYTPQQQQAALQENGAEMQRLMETAVKQPDPIQNAKNQAAAAAAFALEFEKQGGGKLDSANYQNGQLRGWKRSKPEVDNSQKMAHEAYKQQMQRYSIAMRQYAADMKYNDDQQKKQDAYIQQWRDSAELGVTRANPLSPAHEQQLREMAATKYPYRQIREPQMPELPSMGGGPSAEQDFNQFWSQTPMGQQQQQPPQQAAAPPQQAGAGGAPPALQQQQAMAEKMGYKIDRTKPVIGQLADLKVIELDVERQRWESNPAFKKSYPQFMDDFSMIGVTLNSDPTLEMLRKQPEEYKAKFRRAMRRMAKFRKTSATAAKFPVKATAYDLFE